ncbi:MAG: Cof-type HAD-IIB family hydrolase [Mycoplasmataceae bacterium]|nr:Cof-type HAD-IIB family hydrolase [Mycoplasmataceae bacterium]
MNNKWLFSIDLDGTLLKNSATGEIAKEDIEAIDKLKKAGHIVTIITGRPWRSSKKAYEALNLDTIVGNYNGAQIHNPSDYSFIPLTSYMNLNDVMYILGDKKIKKHMSNLAIEGPGWVMLQKRDKDLERVFGFSDAAKLKIGINFHKLPLRPTGIIFDTKPGLNIVKMKDYLQRRYGDLVEFSSWSKGEGLTPVFDMTNVGVTKAKAVSLMARYYDVPMRRTATIGDGYNDVPMFEVSEISAAVANSSTDIKAKTTYQCMETNKTGGVAEFINAFLKGGDSFIKEQRKIRSNLHKIETQTTKAH